MGTTYWDANGVSTKDVRNWLPQLMHSLVQTQRKCTSQAQGSALTTATPPQGRHPPQLEYQQAPKTAAAATNQARSQPGTASAPPKGPAKTPQEQPPANPAASQTKPPKNPPTPPPRPPPPPTRTPRVGEPGGGRYASECGLHTLNWIFHHCGVAPTNRQELDGIATTLNRTESQWEWGNERRWPHATSRGNYSVNTLLEAMQRRGTTGYLGSASLSPAALNPQAFLLGDRAHWWALLLDDHNDGRLVDTEYPMSSVADADAYLQEEILQKETTVLWFHAPQEQRPLDRPMDAPSREQDCATPTLAALLDLDPWTTAGTNSRLTPPGSTPSAPGSDPPPSNGDAATESPPPSDEPDDPTDGSEPETVPSGDDEDEEPSPMDSADCERMLDLTGAPPSSRHTAFPTAGSRFTAGTQRTVDPPEGRHRQRTTPGRPTASPTPDPTASDSSDRSNGSTPSTPEEPPLTLTVTLPRSNGKARAGSSQTMMPSAAPSSSLNTHSTTTKREGAARALHRKYTKRNRYERAGMWVRLSADDQALLWDCLSQPHRRQLLALVAARPPKSDSDGDEPAGMPPTSQRPPRPHSGNIREPTPTQRSQHSRTSLEIPETLTQPPRRPMQRGPNSHTSLEVPETQSRPARPRMRTSITTSEESPSNDRPVSTRTRSQNHGRHPSRETTRSPTNEPAEQDQAQEQEQEPSPWSLHSDSPIIPCTLR
eukprot:NODE_93_length_2182_cov_99.912799_g70_i0.p1 GENE.NODE_93_length_2182_cov_99.912799_g70_i0~~NODE_93_length_2182_cov_99.912799_g70_i0.p1  ORF type:complete len:712 (-),score=52.35 NODE_93_length_2182_cov_99.912799_g70_i0:14-2149(-)